ncbi:MAG: flavin reductase family protein [Firmicutes bacterium]|nr:flavin reductase family protein [Bacillota bacterium]
MAKVHLKPHTFLTPVPAVMVSCGTPHGKQNIITIAWAGTVCSDPPMLSIAVRPLRYSYSMIAETGEFVVNIPSSKLTKALDYCGMVSGRTVDKFADCGLTAVTASKLQYAPLIAECPLNLECKVEQELTLGSHALFLARIVAVQADEDVLDGEQRIDQQLARPVAYAGGHYYELGTPLGRHGFSR